VSKGGSRLASVILATSFLATCGPSPDELAAKTARENAAKKRQAARQNEALLMTDLFAAAAELARRLEDNVSVRGDLIVVRTRLAAPHA
jgi:hypothetical protein